MTDIPLPRRPDKVSWWKKLFGLNDDEQEEISFAGGRTTADNHVERPPGDRVEVDEDIGLLTSTRNGLPDFKPQQ